MQERIESLKRVVQWGLDSGKTNMIVDLDVLAAVLNLSVETGPRVILLHMPVCHHGFRSGWAYAQVGGEMRRLYTSQSDRTDYCRHRGEVIELFAAGKGETYD